MYKDNIRQFKLSTGEEIICEVMQWDDDENPSLIIRCAMKIIESMSPQSGLRLFSFTPWMSFIEDPKELCTVCSEHIIGEVTPSEQIIIMFQKCLKKYRKFLSSKPNNRPEPVDLDDLENMEEDELFELLTKPRSNVVDFKSDSDNNDNVIKFNPKTIH